MPTFDLIANTLIDQNSDLTESLMTKFKNRDIANSYKPLDLEHAEQSTTAGSGSPLAILDTYRTIYSDSNRLHFEADLKAGDGTTTGTYRITVGGTVTATLSIVAGDTTYQTKSVEVDISSLSAGRVSVKIELWRTAGASSVYAKQPGIICYLYNNET